MPCASALWRGWAAWVGGAGGAGNASFRLAWFGLALLLAVRAACGAIVLDTDTLLGPLDTVYEGQDVVVSNCVLSVDGPHAFASLRVIAGGTLTHSGATNGVLSLVASVADEPQLLTGTNAVSLLYSNVVAGAVVVRDATGTATYAPDLDYSLGSSNQFTTLQRTDPSSIPDGATVLVSYSYVFGTTNSGLTLTIAGDLEVEAGSAINADSRGYSGNNGGGQGASAGNPASGGGGSHGGYGGVSADHAGSGPANDALFQPVRKGSGGGNGSGGVGGAGGGALYLSVGGNATIDGVVSASGADGTNSRSGGGSGGAIWLSAQTLLGSGTISADGGAGESGIGGGGGGGRIALYFATNQFAGSVVARGGSGFVGGGAGTIYRQAAAVPAVVPCA